MRPLANFDVLGAFLVTGGMLLLVYALVKAPDVGWGTTRTIAELAGAGAMLAAFVVERIAREKPAAAAVDPPCQGSSRCGRDADAGRCAGFLSMFFFLTLYMQTVLGYSPIQTGLAYLPLTAASSSRPASRRSCSRGPARSP